MVEIGRLLTAMVTPYKIDGSVDYEEAGQLACALLRSGSGGVVVCGTTGEAPTLSREEKLRLFSAVKSAVGDRGVVFAGTGTNSTAGSIDLSVAAARTGVDGLLLTVPYYNRPPQEGLFRHFEAIARATNLPCIPYNIPGRTGVNMTAETALRLARIPNIVGIKEASGNLEQIARIAVGAPEGFRVWSGNDGDTLPILAVGGYGVICVLSHLVGLQMRQLIESFLACRWKEAATLHQQLLPLNDALMTLASNPIPIKYALSQLGVPVGPPRLPLVEPDGATGEKIMEAVRRYKIDLPIVAARD